MLILSTYYCISYLTAYLSLLFLERYYCVFELLALPDSICSSCSSIDLVRPVYMLLGMYLLDSTLKNRKTIEKERYELMESHIHYVSSRA